MRKPIRQMVDKYYKEAGLHIPFTIKFTNTKTPAKLKTTYNSKTKEILKSMIMINDKHYQQLAKVDIKLAKKYLQYTIAHEIGHLKRTQDNWNEARGSGVYLSKQYDAEEDYADKFAFKMTKTTSKKIDVVLKTLQSKYDAKQKASRSTKSTTLSKAETEALKKKYGKFFSKK